MLNTSMDYLMTGNALFKESATISKEDVEILVLLQQLPHDAKVEFRGEIKGYIKGLAASGEAQEVRQAK
jgi:glutaredoxin 2